MRHAHAELITRSNQAAAGGTMAYLPIEDYGLIGNMQTAALVGIDGSIDWLCLPHFDSPSVFAAILDDAKGGRFSVCPRDDGFTARQVYWPDTNILITRFLLDEGVVEVTDYMPVSPTRGQAGYRQLVRRVEVIRGVVPLQMLCEPRFNYARDGHSTHLIERGAVFSSKSLTLQLMTSAPLELTGPENAPGVKSDLTLRQGDRIGFALRVLDPNHASAPVLSDELEQSLFEATVLFWHQWVSQCTYVGRWREMVTRSALLLKLLTFDPTGALVAAVLYEHIADCSRRVFEVDSAGASPKQVRTSEGAAPQGEDLVGKTEPGGVRVINGNTSATTGAAITIGASASAIGGERTGAL